MRAVFQHLKVPKESWATAVETRYLQLLREAEPWQCIKAGLTNPKIAEDLFGEDLTKTHVSEVQIKFVADPKALHATVPRHFVVEIGATGMENYFHSVGGKGKMLATGAEQGYILAMKLEENLNPYDYRDSEWQSIATICATEHLKAELARGLDPSKAGAVTVSALSTEALVPLRNELQRSQSAHGILVNLHVKGVNFDREAEDAAGGFGVVPAPRIKLKGHFPSGLLSPDGMQPLFGLTPFKLVVHGLSEAPKYAWLDGIRAYVPPSAIEAALTAGETLGSAKTEHRRTERRRAGKQRRGDHEDGEISDGGSSTTSSKVARGISAMAFGRDDNDIT